MPWCETCAKFWNPNSLPAEGRCPTCGRELEAAKAPAVATDPRPGGEAAGEPEGRTRAPWHFKLLLVAVVLYLGWRFVQMIGWLIG